MQMPSNIWDTKIIQDKLTVFSYIIREYCQFVLYYKYIIQIFYNCI